MTTMKSTNAALPRRAVLAGAMSALALAATADVGAAQTGGMVDLRVVDRETGREARVWRHDGRLYVAGRPGARYALRVTNNSPGRVLVVLSVDGVNVLTGQTAGYDQKGYVLRPYVTADVAGWRKSDTEIAAFTFSPQSQSYASRTGRPLDVGVIGLAAFTERAAPPPPPPPPPVAVYPQYESRDSTAGSAAAGRAYAPAAPPAPPAPVMAQAAPQRAERLGTGHGEREWSVVSTVAFERASSRPAYVAQLEYDSYENLVARGVIPRARPVPQGPRPFPGEGYVPDPPR